MRTTRILAAVLSAFEALVIVVVGLAIPLVPLTIVWVTHLDSGVEWGVYYRAAADIWLLGHGVHFTLTLDPAIASSLNLPGIDAPFLLSLAPAAFAVITFLMAMRLGRRTVEAEIRFVGPLSALVVFAAAALFLGLSSISPGAMPTLWRVFCLPTLIFLVGLLIGARGEIGRSGGRAEKVKVRLTLWTRTLSPQVRAWFHASLVGGASTVAAVVAAAGVVTAILCVARFAPIVGLYEGLQAGPGGGAVITLGQLLFLPNIVIWVMSWLSGAGFAVGQGSWVSPSGADIGPLPALPIFGMIPEGQVLGGYIWLIIPVVATIICSRVVRGRLLRFVPRHESSRWLFATAIGMSIVAGVITVTLAWATSGSIGPGRMSHFGPTPWITMVWVVVETLVAAVIGLLTPGRATQSR